MVEVRALATDAVVLREGGDGTEVLLLERSHDPYEGRWVLPGGLVEPDERAREACAREAREETGVDVTVEGFVGLYDDPDRDPRGNVSAAYRCRSGDADPEPREEARRVAWFPTGDLPATGFDHGRIVRDAVE